MSGLFPTAEEQYKYKARIQEVSGRDPEAKRVQGPSWMDQNVRQPGTNLFRSVVPANYRTFASTVLGDRSDITEDNFTEDELDVLRLQIQRKRGEVVNTLARMKRSFAFNKTPEGEKFNRAKYQRGYSAWVPNAAQEEAMLKSFADTSHKTTIDDPYFAYQGAGDSQSHYGYNMVTTLGRYQGILDKYGNTTAKDTYNWAPATRPFMEGFKEAGSPREYGNLFMRHVLPNASRKVNINLGKIDPDISDKNKVNKLYELDYDAGTY